MAPIPRFLENDNVSTPKIFWLKLTELLLHCAIALFSVSRSRGLSPLEAPAVQALRLACRALGHAPAQGHIEFRADLPVQI